jgi:hypothetical protein
LAFAQDAALPDPPYSARDFAAIARPDASSAWSGRMFLIEFLLPVYDNAGLRFPSDEFDRVRRELTGRFGGCTAFLRSPAAGLWADAAGRVRRDDLAIFEVMTDAIDRDWWRGYREQLERRFRQQEIVMRATPFERL